MKLAFVSMKYCYGNPQRGIDYLSEDGFKKSFEFNGIEVIPFYFDSYLENQDSLASDFELFVEKINPDVIFFLPYTDQFTSETLDRIKKKFITIAWFGDDTWRFDSYTAQYARHYTWCITTDKFSIQKYPKVGQDNVIYSQWAAIDEHKIPEFRGYKFDVSFVGGYSDSRAWFIEKLREKGIIVSVYGYGWPNGSLDNEEMNQLFRDSKINLNLSNSMSFDIRYILFKLRRMGKKRRLISFFQMLLGVRKFLEAVSEPKAYGQIKARNFEIPYFGGFQLSDYFPTIEEYFDIGKEIACFTTPDEAVILIKYYLENGLERERIRDAGHERAVREHGYKNRIKELIEKIKNI